MILTNFRERLIFVNHNFSSFKNTNFRKWGQCQYVIVRTILGGSPVILWISPSGKPKWLPLKFGYHDVMRTSPIGPAVDQHMYEKILSKDQRMKEKGDHRSRNSAQYERVVELLIMHKAKWTPRQISLLPLVSRPRSIIRQLRKSLEIFEVV